MKNFTGAFSDELEQLIERGEKLSIFLYGTLGELSGKAQNEFNRNKDKYPVFCDEYEGWYTISLRLIGRVTPERLEDFVNLYKNKKIKDIGVQSYGICDYLLGFTVGRGGKVVADGKTAAVKFESQLNILRAVKAVLNSKLADIEGEILAHLYDKELASTRQLVRNGFFRSAGVVAGVVLEKHLTKVCLDNKLKIKSNPSINDLNQLLKDGNLIDIPNWRLIQRLGDIRNLCGHNKDREPTKEEVSDLVDGVDKISKTIF